MEAECAWGSENALAFQISGGAKGGRDSVVPVVLLCRPIGMHGILLKRDCGKERRRLRRRASQARRSQAFVQRCPQEGQPALTA